MRLGANLWRVSDATSPHTSPSRGGILTRLRALRSLWMNLVRMVVMTAVPVTFIYAILPPQRRVPKGLKKSG